MKSSAIHQRGTQHVNSGSLCRLTEGMTQDEKISQINRVYGILSLLKERELLRSLPHQNRVLHSSYAAAEMAAELLEEVLQTIDC